jgi:hypothetical protein
MKTTYDAKERKVASLAWSMPIEIRGGTHEWIGVSQGVGGN